MAVAVYEMAVHYAEGYYIRHCQILLILHDTMLHTLEYRQDGG